MTGKPEPDSPHADVPRAEVPRVRYVPSSGVDTAAHWAAYTDASQRIAAILRTEHARATAQAAAAKSGQAGIEQVATRLAAQRQHLAQLAATLRLPTPHLDGIAPSPVADPGEALQRAHTAANVADASAQAAHRRATQPPLLPGLTPTARNALVYTAAAFAGTLISLLMFTASPNTEFGKIPWQLVPWSLCGFPALAFFAGYLTISLVGQPRLGERGTRSARLGGVICFVGMPILWFIFIAATSG